MVDAVRQPAHLSVALNAQLLSLRRGYRNAGISRYIYGLLYHLPLADSTIRYTVYTHERGGQLPGLRRVVTRWNTHRPAMRIVWEQIVWPAVLARESLPVHVIHGLAYALPLVVSVPAVVTVYDLSFIHLPNAFRPWNRLYLRVMTRIAARKAAHVCVISENTRRDVARWLGLPESHISVVYPGVDGRFERPAEAALAAFRQRRGVPERFVLYLGTLEPRKNLVQLLRAYARLARHDSHVPPLVLAGGRGWGAEAIFAEVERLGLAERVRFPGYIPSDEQPYWYAAAELFVYPSRYEGFGMPVLEAMACGTPVLTSDSSSLPEVVGTAGVMVNPDDEEALADALADLLASPEQRAQLGQAARERARQFSWLRAARQQVVVYRRLVAHGEDGV
ncbi:MAG: glycosyltransferase family 1 protein [Ardenticatenia bacterium]|nr:glycosyltransferase family 1 protein [Ardenticatenia bacterium]